MFVDRAKIHVKSGKGGNGAVSFRREPFVPEGGPDGGDGGKGGDVVIVADRNLRTLMDFRYKRKYAAENGTDGKKKKCYGKGGSDIIIRVPAGTIVIDEASGKVMKDLVKDGDSFVAVKGGKGGKGNVHFKSSVRQAPNFAEAGEAPKERDLILELKMIADVGLVGFPNAGKSSLLAAATGAKPKIGNYPFTTIDPNLGVVEMFDDGFVMADIAGIIDGAHTGTGLGIKFLKHVERTRLLIHVVDAAGSEGRKPVDDFEKVNRELKLYNDKLMKKPMIVAANKIDLVSEEDEGYFELKKMCERSGYKIFPISVATGQGIRELLGEAVTELKNTPELDDPIEDMELYDFEAEENDDDYTKVNVSFNRHDNVYELYGKQLQKIFDSTNFNDYGSLRYLYKYIEKSGAVSELKKLGMKEGDIVRLFDYELEYYDEY